MAGEGRRDRANPAEAVGNAGGHGGRRIVSGLAAGVLCRRPDHRGGRRADFLNAGTGARLDG
jgi:hypothetical protein